MTWTRRGLLAAGVAGTAGCLGAVGERGPACPAVGDAEARIGFVGDLMLGRYVNERWAEADPTRVWGSTLERLQGLDGVVANLECCLSDRGEPWPEKTYHFRATPSFAGPALAAANVSVAALGNNHVLDFGEVALEDTVATLDDYGVAHAGAGPDLDRALAPAVVDVGGSTVATISLTDRFAPFAASTDDAGTAYTEFGRPGSTSLPFVRTALEWATARDPDLVVASLHWGPNWQTEPSTGHPAFARWLIDNGVDVVHGHSAHVLQGVEVYRGRPIIYDAGDFVDDYVEKEQFHNKQSALFELGVSDGRLEELRVVPIEIREKQATLADGESAAWVRTAMGERSAPFETTVERAATGLRIPLDGC